MARKHCILLLGIATYFMGLAGSTIGSLHGHHGQNRDNIQPFGPVVSHSLFRVFDKPLAPEISPPNSMLHDPMIAQTDIPDHLLPELATVHAYVYSQWNLDPLDYKVTDIYRSEHNGVTHVYLRRMVKGLEVANANANFNVDSSGRIFSVGLIFPSKGFLRNSKITIPTGPKNWSTVGYRYRPRLLKPRRN